MHIYVGVYGYISTLTFAPGNMPAKKMVEMHIDYSIHVYTLIASKAFSLSPRIHSHFRFIYAKLGTLFDHTHCRVIQPIFMNDMLISWHENAFFINGLLWKEFIRDQWIRLTKDSNKDVWHFHLLLVWTSCWNGCVADDLRHNGSHGTSL